MRFPRRDPGRDGGDTGPDRGRSLALPAHVRAAVPGRVLASAAAKDGIWLAGTRHALIVVRDGQAASLGWERVQHADWDADTSTLTVEEVRDYGGPVSASAYVLARPGSILTLVRERVTASIVVQRRVDLARRRGFTVVGRRAPDGMGPVTWAWAFDPGVNPLDPAVRSAAEQALREAQESVGL